MNLFSTALLLTLFHSLWQSLLISIYIYFDGILYKNQSPDTKTKKLLLLLSVQFFISVTTFIIFYNESEISKYSVSLLPQVFSFNNLISNIAPYVTVVYFLFLITKSSITLVNWIKLKHQFMSNLVKVNVDIKLFTLQKSFELGIKRKIKIWYSDHISSPVTFGYFKPVILLPLALMSKLTVAETEALILHELTHIKNNDFLFNWFLIVNEHIFYFNPFIKKICTQIRWERELRCDLQVLHYNYNEITYAESLFKVANAGQSNTSGIFLAAVSSRFSLLQRIEFITSHKHIKIKPSRFQQTTFSFSMLVLSLLLIASVYFNATTRSIKLQSFSSQISTSNIVKLVSSNKNIVTSKEINTVNKSVRKVRSVKVNNKANKFLIEHKELPVTQKSIQNDINIDLLKENETVSFISHKERNPKNEKQIIVKEENAATGEVVTKSYQLIKRNGIWESTLLWVITEKPSNLNMNKSGNSEHPVQ